jgi:hypothetical protein
MAIKIPCYNCSGTGTITPPAGTGSGVPYQCPVCVGVGKLVLGEVEDIDTILDRCDDLVIACADILEKCTEIKEVVDGL